MCRYSGLDATEKFEGVGHSEYAISLRNARHVGTIASKSYPEGYEEKMRQIKK